MKALKGMAFDHTMKTSLKLVTYKFVLLLAIVTIRRIGNLCHLVIEEFCRFQYFTITLLPFFKEVVNQFFSDKLLDFRRVVIYYLKATKIKDLSKEPNILSSMFVDTL